VSAPAEATFDTAPVGVRVESEPLDITAEATRRFAEATNDRNEDHVAGRLAPPLYALVPVLKTMVRAKNAVTTAFAFHGEHDLLVHRPLEPGMRVQVGATVIGVRQRSAGVATIVHVETRSLDHELLNEQYFTSFVSGGHVAGEAGDEGPPHVPPPAAGPVREATMPVDDDQTRRFAAAADDWDAYTLDEQVAQSMGFPTMIVHGTCTMAFASRAIVETACAGDSRRLKRFAARLTRPLLLVPGQALTTRVWPAAADGRDAFGFEAIDHEGTRMIKNGWAEVSG
jgi:acyl dehydratase